MPSYTVIGKRIERDKAVEPDPPWQQFRISASCPPDTQLHIRGGRVYSGPGLTSPGQARWYESASLDLATTTAIDYTFAAADYYLGLLLCADLASDDDEWAAGNWNFYIYGDSAEYATAEEAEDHALTCFSAAEIWLGRLPLCLLVLRNNGNITQANQFLPIEPLNRGQSYFWRDVRPRSSYGQ